MNIAKTKKAMLLAAALGAAAYAGAEEYYVKQVIFPPNATLEQKIDMAARLVPTKKQLAWQEMELTAFLHFGINTFTDREWGDGTEDPAIFNPDSLDTDQWVKTLSDAGFKMAMLTAKHHDGFCLWPTATTTHSVAASPWRNGQGDVVADLAESCRKYGMKLGLYLSPWDRNAECYGDSPRYNDMFVAQLTELLTRYGKVDEVWFDGACGEGPNGKKQEYDWQRFKETIETLQPEAVMAIMGDDVRWVGNEKGVGRETEWSATAFVPGILPNSDEINKGLDLFSKAPDLGSREVIARADKLYWWPSEVDVSIRPGWFYHEKEAPHSLNKLANIYINSVGRNSVLLLNIPPDTHGLISQADVERLMELRQWIDANFTNSLAKEAQGMSVAVNPAEKFNAVVIAENISKGQRVEGFEIQAYVDGKWQPIAEGTTIGKKRIMMFDPISADSVRVDVKQSRAMPLVDVTGVYNVKMPINQSTALPQGFAFVDKTFWNTTDHTQRPAYDSNPDTFWQSADGENSIVIDMGKVIDVAGFSYLPRQDEKHQGTIFLYDFYVSEDGENWSRPVLTGEFSNIVNNPIAQLVYRAYPVKARYFRLVSNATADGSPFITIADLNIITKE